MTSRYHARPIRASRRLAWVRALGETAVFLFFLAVAFLYAWLGTP